MRVLKALPLLALLCVGCAGGSHEIFRGPTPYTGSYTGTLSTTGPARSGSFAMTVTPTAGIVGSYTDSLGTYPLEGSIGRTGDITAAVKAPTDPFTIKGFLSEGGTGIVGNGTSGGGTFALQATRD